MAAGVGFRGFAAVAGAGIGVFVWSATRSDPAAPLRSYPTTEDRYRGPISDPRLRAINCAACSRIPLLGGSWEEARLCNKQVNDLSLSLLEELRTQSKDLSPDRAPDLRRRAKEQFWVQIERAYAHEDRAYKVGIGIESRTERQFGLQAGILASQASDIVRQIETQIR
jgi:hypothetical protein